MKKKILFSSIFLGSFLLAIILPGPVGGQTLLWSVESNPSPSFDSANSIVADESYLYIAGVDYSAVSGWGQWRIEKRRKFDGGIEWTQISDPSPEKDIPFSITADDTYLYIAGYDKNNPAENDAQWRIEKRRKSDGGLEWAVTHNSYPAWREEYARSIIVDNTYIYLAGIDAPVEGGDQQWRIEKRRKSDGYQGDEDPNTWIIISDPSDNSDYATSITADNTYIYIAGVDRSVSEYPIDTQWRIEKRRKSDGGLEWAVAENPSFRGDSLTTIAADDTFLYVAGYDMQMGDSDARWRIHKYRKDDGSCVWRRFNNPSSGYDGIESIAVDDEYLYLVGYDEIPGSYPQWRVEKRRKGSGGLLWVETYNPTSRGEWANSVTIDNSYLYIAGVVFVEGESGSDTQWRIEKRGKVPFSFFCQDHNVWGWAWSNMDDPATAEDESTIGWISFSCRNTMNEGEGIDYGVDIDEDTGIFSGYAWSENIGWISFNRSETEAPPSDDACSDGSCIAKLDLVTGEVSGWARALAPVDQPPIVTGDWDGWIKLSGDWLDGVSLYSDPDPSEFENWAWGSDVVGWISFNCSNTGVCATSNYQVMTNIIIGPAPSATNLNVTEDSYCSPITEDFESGGSRNTPPIYLNWTFDDPEDIQSAYQIQVDDSGSGFPSPEVDTEKVISSSPSYVPSLNFGTTYWWRLKVWDSGGRESDWVYPTPPGDSFPTDIRWPDTDFIPDLENPPAGVEVIFTDNSICYKSDGSDYLCQAGDTPPIGYVWDFGDGSPVDDTKGTTTYTYSIQGDYIVRLEVADNIGICPYQYPLTSKLPLPKWEEIAPF